MMGMPLMPWQRYVADVALEVDPVTGWWVYDEVDLTVQRRAGKSALTGAVKTHRLATGRRRKLWMSAQSGVKSLDRWTELKELLEDSELAHKIRAYTSIGHERIVWRDTLSRLVPFAPDGDLLHGEAVDLLDLDELWSYDAAQASVMKAGYRPAFLTTNAQAWLYSTAGTPASAWLNEIRKIGRATVDKGGNRGVAYFEWSMPELLRVGTGGKSVLVPWEEVEDDRILIAAALAAHPAIEHHPKVPAQRMRDIITADLPDMGRAEWVRAYGNLTAVGDAHRLFPESVVTAATAGPIPADVDLELAVDVDPDRRDAALYAGGRDAGGRARVEQIAYGPGTRWLAPRAIANARAAPGPGCGRVAFINVGAARDVGDEIARAGVPVLPVSSTDWAAACARTHDELKETQPPTFLHRGEQELLDAFAHVGWRPLGAGRAFTSESGESITTVTAATLAAWAADHPHETEPDLGPFEIR